MSNNSDDAHVHLWIQRTDRIRNVQPARHTVPGGPAQSSPRTYSSTGNTGHAEANARRSVGRQGSRRSEGSDVEAPATHRRKKIVLNYKSDHVWRTINPAFPQLKQGCDRRQR